MASSNEAQTPNKKLKLYAWWKSSASARVRIALHLKGLEYEYIEINILKGDQFTPEYKKLSPRSFVPALVDGDVSITESSAIIQYLEEKFPQRSLFPPIGDLPKRALNTQVASILASSIQPFINIQVLKYIEDKVGPDERLPWAQLYFKKGFTALEQLLEEHAGKYATGDEIYLADVYLGPEIDGAIKLFKVDMNEFPLLKRLYDSYYQLSIFKDSVFETQPDA